MIESMPLRHLPPSSKGTRGAENAKFAIVDYVISGRRLARSTHLHRLPRTTHPRTPTHPLRHPRFFCPLNEQPENTHQKAPRYLGFRGLGAVIVLDHLVDCQWRRHRDPPTVKVGVPVLALLMLDARRRVIVPGQQREHVVVQVVVREGNLREIRRESTWTTRHGTHADTHDGVGRDKVRARH